MSEKEEEDDWDDEDLVYSSAPAVETKEETSAAAAGNEAPVQDDSAPAPVVDHVEEQKEDNEPEEIEENPPPEDNNEQENEPPDDVEEVLDQDDTTAPPATSTAARPRSNHHHRESLTRPIRSRTASFTEPPPPFRAISDHARADMHGRLRAFENRRRSAMQARLESSSLYWRSFRDLLHASVQETARAERLVVGTARAHLQYSNTMRASYQDSYLDDKGHVVVDAKKQQNLMEQRRKENEKRTDSSNMEDSKRAHMLSTLIESQLILAEKFGENAKHLEQEIASEITALKDKLMSQVDNIQFLGNAILAELEQTEAEVSKAWESYFAVASKVIGGPSSVGSSTKSSKDLSSTASDADQCKDVWVVEMQYRVAVAYQSAAWDKGSSELSTLFASMKDTECKRRIDLREYLVAFVQRQERLYHSLPEVYTPVLRDLVGRDMDRNSIEEQVQATIRKRAETLQREEAKSRPLKKRGSGLTGTVSQEKDEKKNFTLESPLMSELLCKAKVIEKRSGGMMSGWKVTMAVVTADAYLHLFDLPPSSRVQNGSAPEVAFQAMIPAVHVPNAETIKSGKINFVKGWCDWLVPSESLCLANCAITTGLNDPNGSAFEIVERLLSSGAKKMLGKKTTTRRLTLRTVTSKETEDWIAALKSQKYPKPPEATLDT